MRGSKGQNAAAAYRAKILSYNPVAYWPLSEESGAVATCLVNATQNGAYVGVTLANAADPTGGGVCPYFDGLNDYVNVYSAALNTAFPRQLGSLLIWLRASAADVWTDGNYHLGISIQVNTANRVWVGKLNANNILVWRYIAGGTTKEVQKVSSTTDWFCMGMTWSLAANRMRAFYNGVQEGLDQGTLGTFVGTALSSTLCTIGSSDATPSFPWSGWEAHAALFNVELTPAQMLDISTP